MANDKTFYLPVSEETTNYLQRLSFEIDGRLEVINRLFTTHANDTDDSVLSSVPFKKYQTEFNEYNAEYTIAKDELGKTLRPIVEEKIGISGVDFDWMIEDFSENKVRITVK